MDIFTLQVKLFAQPEKRNKLYENFQKISAFMESQVPGCHKYNVTKDTEDENALLIIEEWDTKESHDASLTIPAVQGFIKENMPLLDLTRK